MPRDVIGEIKRPLIFKLKSLFMLFEIVASKMYVKDCVYPVLGVENQLGVAKQFGVSLAGSAAAGTYIAAAGSTVPVGKRWRVKLISIVQTSAVALASAAAAFSLAQGAGVGTQVPATAMTTAGAAGQYEPQATPFFDLVLEPGDSFGLIVVVSAAATAYAVSAVVMEDDFRENVV